MAPLKTYGSKKPNLLVKVTGRVTKKSLRGSIIGDQVNYRRPLATLQSAIILSPRKQLVKNTVPNKSAKCKAFNGNAALGSLKRPKKKLVKFVSPCGTVSAKSNLLNRSATVSSPSFPGSEELSSISHTDGTIDNLLQSKIATVGSPSFPGSEELSSIWNADSTFDRLLQSNKNIQPVLSEAVINTGSICNVAEEINGSKPVETPTRCIRPQRSKIYKLRPYETLETRNTHLHSLTSSQCSISSSNSSSSRSVSRNKARQVTSTPNVIQGSSRLADPTDTPIYPTTEQTIDKLETLDDTPQLPTRLSEVAEPELTHEITPLTPKSSKASMICKGVCSPDMFSNLSIQTHSEICSNENLSSKKSCDGGVVLQRRAGNSMLARCSDDTTNSKPDCNITQNFKTKSNVLKSNTSLTNSDILEADILSKNASKSTLFVEDDNSQLKPDASNSLSECSTSSKSSMDSTSYIDQIEVAGEPLDYVNLRNRKVQWHSSLSLKNTLSRLEEESVIIDEVISVEVENGVTVAKNPAETSPAFESDANLKQGLRRVVFAEPPKSLLPSAAIGRRTSIWMSSRSRAASRRFSVIPAKVLAQFRPESLGFRDLHGILAPPLSKQENFNGSLDGTHEDLSAVSIEASPVTPTDAAVPITARDVVLQKCRQNEPLPFEEVFPEEYLSKCRKIGEGLFGEVFMWENHGHSSVIKVIPIDGQQLVNGEPQKTFGEILSEIVITKELSDLRHRELAVNDSDDLTSGFVEVKRTACVYGKYPERLLELWQEFADNSGTENDNPDELSDTQLFIVLELAHGGADLEKFVFNGAAQALSILLQTAYALAAAEQRIQFEHRDLHWGNVLVSKTNAKHLDLVIDGNARKVLTHGVQVSIIDFTLSRMTYDGCCIFNDLSQDDSLFVSEGDYQFDVYRIMRENCRNDWREFVPANNIVWLHYLVDKMIAGVHYRNTHTKVHKKNLGKLCSFKKTLLDYKSTGDFVASLV